MEYRLGLREATNITLVETYQFTLETLLFYDFFSNAFFISKYKLSKPHIFFFRTLCIIHKIYSTTLYEYY